MFQIVHCYWFCRTVSDLAFIELYQITVIYPYRALILPICGLAQYSTMTVPDPKQPVAISILKESEVF